MMMTSMPVGFPDDQAGFVALPFLGRITFAKIHAVINLAVLVGTVSTVSTVSTVNQAWTERGASRQRRNVVAVEYVTADVPMHYVEQGEGLPVLTIHGAGVDHREVMACLDPVFDAFTGYRRIYPDLPGMGRTPAPETIRSADDVLEVLLGFIDGVIGDQPMLVAGHSAGGYYAQAIARQRPGQVVGLALLCPLLPGIHDVPEHQVVCGSGTLGDADFQDYFTVQTTQTLDS